MRSIRGCTIDSAWEGVQNTVYRHCGRVTLDCIASRCCMLETQ